MPDGNSPMMPSKGTYNQIMTPMSNENIQGSDSAPTQDYSSMTKQPNSFTSSGQIQGPGVEGTGSFGKDVTISGSNKPGRY